MGCTYGKLVNLNGPRITKDHKGVQQPASLTPDQAAVIIKNWQTLKLHVANLGVVAFVSMFKSRPELKELYSKFRDKDIRELKSDGLLQQHALRVMATVDKCITQIDEPENFAATLHEVGVSHRKYNVPPEYIKIILPHFLSAIKPHIEHEWTEDTSEAWEALFTLIVFYIAEGIKGSSVKQHSKTAILAK